MSITSEENVTQYGGSEVVAKVRTRVEEKSSPLLLIRTSPRQDGTVRHLGNVSRDGEFYFEYLVLDPGTGGIAERHFLKISQAEDGFIAVSMGQNDYTYGTLQVRLN